MNFLELLSMDKGAEYLKYNASLQKKKNALRKALNEKGVLKRAGNNAFDKYTYFSEAQYKELFTELLSKVGLELKFEELEYNTFDGSEKQANGRMVKILFTLMDIDTGFGETTVITGEAIDKGDKAGYKAYTGALKYYLADTFMVATGDDPENENLEVKMNKKAEKTERKATPKQVEYLKSVYTGDREAKLLEENKISKIEDLPLVKASDLIAKIAEKIGEAKNGK